MNSKFIIGDGVDIIAEYVPDLYIPVTCKKGIIRGIDLERNRYQVKYIDDTEIWWFFPSDIQHEGHMMMSPEFDLDEIHIAQELISQMD
jgi:hypothetical protein